MARYPRRLSCTIAILAALAGTTSAEEKLTYLFPAPSFLPAFAPFQIAQRKGYYKEAGLAVDFQVGKGGVDVAKQVGVGNADLGGAVGDTPIIVRPQGIQVRSVAILGGRALAQIIVRKDANIKSLADLKGRTVVVMSFQDNTYYSMLAALAKFDISRGDIEAQAVGPAAIVNLLVANKAVAMAGVPEWAVAVELAGVPVDLYSVEDYFPGMAQAILASDEAIKRRPSAIRAFVHATLRGMKDIMTDSGAAAKTFTEAVPQYRDRETEVAKTLKLYAERVYPGQATPGTIDPKRVAAVQDYYLKTRIIDKGSNVDDLYTNDFVR